MIILMDSEMNFLSFGFFASSELMGHQGKKQQKTPDNLKDTGNTSTWVHLWVSWAPDEVLSSISNYVI